MINNKKVIGIICECNPFHNGHKFLINKTKKMFNDPIIIAIMSGNFVERGEPAIHDKWTRAKSLLANDIDLVIELPIAYSLSSAKYFARAGVNILSKLSIVDNIIFGASDDNISILKQYANIDIENDTTIKNYLKEGIPYPAAISKLYDTTLSSNDILGIEYIRAINELNSSITPICIKRSNKYKTATSIRNSIKNKITANDFSQILFYKIIKAFHDNSSFNDIYTITNELNNKILNTANYDISFDERANMLNTKNKTLANIKRAFFNIIFDIKKTDVQNQNFGLNIPFIRIIGIKKTATYLLTSIKLPYLLSVAPKSYKDFFNKNNCSPDYLTNNALLNTNIFADNLYYSFYQKYHNINTNHKTIFEASKKILIY